MKRWAAAAGLSAAFVALALVVANAGGMIAGDLRSARWIDEHRIGWLTSAFLALTWLGSSVVLGPAAAAGALVLLRRGRPRAALAAVLAFLGSVASYQLVKGLLERPRPPSALAVAHAGGFAFPSGHATSSLTVWCVLAWALSVRDRGDGRPPASGAWPAAAAAVTALVVAASRVYLGVHWLTDVVGGLLLGGAWLAAIVAATRTRA